MHKTKTLLAAVTLSLVALAGYSQAQSPSPTPNPLAGTYEDPTLSIAQRITLGQAILSSGTATGDEVFNVYHYLLNLRPVSALLADAPGMDAQVLADPTLSGTIAGSPQISNLLLGAVNWKLQTIPALNDKVTFLQPYLTGSALMVSDSLNLLLSYQSLVCQQAQAQITAGNYSGAITTLAPVLGYGGTNAIVLTFQAKLAAGSSSDILSWAKLVYTVLDWPHSQAGVDAENSAFKLVDGASLNRVNENNAFQTSGTASGADPMAGVALPSGITFSGTSAAAQALSNIEAGGSYAASIRIAYAAFVAAPTGPQVNAMLNLMAQWLRNTDDSWVRPSAFITAIKAGQSYAIPELTQ